MSESANMITIFPQTESGFEKMYKEFYPLLYSISIRVTNQHEETEEVIHDVFLKLWKEKDVLEINTSLKAYLGKSILNASLNKIKQGKMRAEHIQNAAAMVDLYVEDNELERDERILNVRAEIAKLPPKCQEVFKLSRYKDLSHKEIAEKLSLSVDTVKSHIGFALKTLRTKLNQNTMMIILFCSIVFFSPNTQNSAHKTHHSKKVYETLKVSQTVSTQNSALSIHNSKLITHNSTSPFFPSNCLL